MIKGTFRRVGIAALGTAFAAVSFGVLPFAAPAAAQTTTDPECDRIDGEDRYGTAAALALETFPGGADTVLIARGDGTPNNLAGVPIDALAGSYGAGQFNAPILLVEGQNPVIDEATVAAIEALNPTNAFVLGQEQAISAEVEAEIDALVENVERVGGADRYETAEIIANASGAPGADGTTFTNSDGESAVFLAAGTDAREGADALTVGGPAWAEHIPILLTESDALNEHAAGFIERNDVDRVYILGGTVAIDGNVAAQVTALNGNGTEITRFEGSGREGTAVDIAIDFLIDELGWSTDHFNLANGIIRHLVDAVAAGPHAGAEESMILLTSGSNDLGQDTETFLEDLSDGTLETGQSVEPPVTAHIIGGPVAITEETAQEACTLAGVDRAAGDEDDIDSATAASIVDFSTVDDTVTVETQAGELVTFTYDGVDDEFFVTCGDASDGAITANGTAATIVQFEEALTVGEDFAVNYDTGGVSRFFAGDTNSSSSVCP